MSRLFVTGMLAASVMITGCQQTKLGSEPLPAKQNAVAPPPRQNPPPGSGGPVGPGPGPGYFAPPPGSGPVGPGPGPGYVAPPPGSGPVGPGPGPGYFAPPPGPGPGNIPPSQPPVTLTEPPITNYPPAGPPPIPPTGSPPTTVQNPPVVQWYDVPPPTQQIIPQCTVNCAGMQIPPTPPPPQEDCRVMNTCPMQPRPPTPPPPQLMQKPMSLPIARPQQISGPQNQVRQNPGPQQQGPQQLAPVVSEPPIVSTPTTVTPPPVPQCDPIPLDSKMDTDKLDILFVVDTSLSMHGGNKSGGKTVVNELAILASEMDVFAKRLDPKTDFRIGMLLGHGPGKGNIHGKLFQTSASDPAVIDFNSEKAKCRGNDETARACAFKRISKILEHKMSHLPTDHTDAQGEALLLSLYDAITNKDLRRAIVKNEKGVEKGLLRKDAVLMVIPISDEQDVCYDYKTCSTEGHDANFCTPAQVAKRDAKGKVTGYGQDQHEVRAFDKICSKAVNKTSPLTPNHVWEALTNLKGGDISRVLFTPVIYLNNNDVPKNQGQDENEVGHGYYDIALLAHNASGDLATIVQKDDKVSFAGILDNLGGVIATRMKYRDTFECSITGVAPAAVNFSTVEVHVFDFKTGQDAAVFTGQCSPNPKIACAGDFTGGAEIKIGRNGNGQQTHFTASVNLNALNDKLKAMGFENGQVLINFKTLSDYDPATGTPKNAQYRRRKPTLQ